MSSANATELKVGDIVRVPFGAYDYDARIIRIEADQFRVRIIWNDPTAEEEDIRPTYVSYTRDEFLDSPEDH